MHPCAEAVEGMRFFWQRGEADEERHTIEMRLCGS